MTFREFVPYLDSKQMCDHNPLAWQKFRADPLPPSIPMQRVFPNRWVCAVCQNVVDRFGPGAPPYEDTDVTRLTEVKR